MGKPCQHSAPESPVKRECVCGHCEDTQGPVLYLAHERSSAVLSGGEAKQSRQHLCCQAPPSSLQGKGFTDYCGMSEQSAPGRDGWERGRRQLSTSPSSRALVLPYGVFIFKRFDLKTSRSVHFQSPGVFGSLYVGSVISSAEVLLLLIRCGWASPSPPGTCPSFGLLQLRCFLEPFSQQPLLRPFTLEPGTKCV